MYSLTVLNGSDMGRKISLVPGREYSVGRAEECDIQVDKSDMTASRKHARLISESKKITIENLSQTNPILVNRVPTQSAVLKPKDEFQVGASLFLVEKAAGSKASPSPGSPRKPSKKILVLALALAVALGWLFMGSPKNKKDSGSTTQGKGPAVGQQTPFVGVRPPAPGAAAAPGQVGMIPVSDADRSNADQHFRQGMFFYETGKLPRALEEWAKAINSYPDHPDARVWYLKAEQELEQEVRDHYQNAMLHYKYMRYEEAAHEFRIVLQLSRNKTSDIYMDALKYLNELQGK
ncbi:MAG: FHA domain-containing protein [Pseudomonadota bacterium]